jgi:hypothetical protein
MSGFEHTKTQRKYEGRIRYTKHLWLEIDTVAWRLKAGKMEPEWKSITSQRLANTCSMEMRIRGDRLGTERAFHVNGINN